MVQAASKRTAKVTLPSDEEILIEREFDAPKHLVYAAYTTPELVKRWWAGQRGEVTECEIHLRVGGRWRYVMLAHGQFEVAFHGEYREIVPSERIVSTQVYEGAPDAPGLATTTFNEVDGRTTLAIAQVGVLEPASEMASTQSTVQRIARSSTLWATPCQAVSAVNAGVSSRRASARNARSPSESPASRVKGRRRAASIASAVVKGSTVMAPSSSPLWVSLVAIFAGSAPRSAE